MMKRVKLSRNGQISAFSREGEEGGGQVSRRSDEVRAMRERDAIRRAEDEQIARIHNIFIIATLLLTALFFAWLGWRSYRQPIEERAAYLEGRYDLDHETAMEYAAQGYGKTSAELLATK